MYCLKSFSNADILVVVFMCNHCPTSQAYEQRMIQLTRDYSNKNVAVVAINPNHPASVRLDELGYSDLGDSYEEMKSAHRMPVLIFHISLTVKRKLVPKNTARLYTAYFHL